MKKQALDADAWMKYLAPSTELRQWFGHRIERWDEFKRRYRKELSVNRQAWAPLINASRRGTVTLLYSARDIEHNGARVLREYLDQRSRAGRLPAKRLKATASRRTAGRTR
jgi:uncharacterized protein YeaO (DUF488 family)